MRIFVDGSYNPEKGKSAWAFICAEEGEIIHEESGLCSRELHEGSAGAEFYGVLKALAWCHKNKVTCLELVHDYEGIDPRHKGHRHNRTFLIKDYRAKFEALSRGLQLRLLQVPAHTDPMHNRAEELARQAAGCTGKRK